MKKHPIKKLLVLAPHTDDAELGCGATIAKLIEEGVSVYVAVFSTAEQSLPKGFSPGALKREFYASMAILGVPPPNLRVFDFEVRKLSYSRQEVLENIVQMRKEIRPDAVFLPSSYDLHQDHQVIHCEGVRAFKEITLMGYELPWNNINFPAVGFFAVEEKHLALKCKALSVYRTQLSMAKAYFKTEFIKGLACVRGVQVAVPYAEAFEVMRAKW